MVKSKVSIRKIKKRRTPTRRKGRMQTMQERPIRLVERGYRDWEWANQFYVWDLYVGNDRVEIEYDTSTRYSPWRVIWEGALDFEGNKKDLLARYPEFRRLLED